MPPIPLSTFIEFTSPRTPRGSTPLPMQARSTTRARTSTTSTNAFECTVQFGEGWSAREWSARSRPHEKRDSFEARRGMARRAQGKALCPRRARTQPGAPPDSMCGSTWSCASRGRLQRSPRQDIRPAILDARRAELITTGEPDPQIHALLISEATAFAALLSRSAQLPRLVEHSNARAVDAARQIPPLFDPRLSVVLLGVTSVGRLVPAPPSSQLQG